MSTLEQRAMESLHRLRFAKGVWHEPRAKSLYRLYRNDPGWRLSTHDQADLWFLIWHYRRQVLDVEVLQHADELVNGALHLRF